VIRGLQEETGPRSKSLRRHGLDRLRQLRGGLAAKKRIETSPRRRVGRVYDGTVLKLLDFGAIVQLLPGKARAAAHFADQQDARQQRIRLPQRGQRVKVKVLEADEKWAVLVVR